MKPDKRKSNQQQKYGKVVLIFLLITWTIAIYHWTNGFFVFGYKSAYQDKKAADYSSIFRAPPYESIAQLSNYGRVGGTRMHFEFEAPQPVEFRSPECWHQIQRTDREALKVEWIYSRAPWATRTWWRDFGPSLDYWPPLPKDSKQRAEVWVLSDDKMHHCYVFGYYTVHERDFYGLENGSKSSPQIAK